jgi:hypothetical protein
MIPKLIEFMEYKFLALFNFISHSELFSESYQRILPENLTRESYQRILPENLTLTLLDPETSSG